MSAPAPVSTTTPPRRDRRRNRVPALLGLLVATALVALCFYPPAWQAGLRALGTEAAARRGLRLEVDRIEGGPTDGMIFHGVHLSGRGTDLRARRVELHFTTPALPYFQRPKGSLLRRLVVDGLEGEVILTPPEKTAPEVAPTLPSPWTIAGLRERVNGWTAALASGLVPAAWSLHDAPTETFTLVAPAAGGSLRARGLRLFTGEPGEPGFFSVSEIEARGPGGFSRRSAALHGGVGWRGSWLTLRGVDLVPGVTLDGFTVEALQLVRRGRLEGEATVRALGGEVRAQGTAGPGPDGRPTLALACSLTGVAVLPVAELLGVPSPVPLGGTVRAGQFSFRGDPARPSEGTGSLLAEVLDFRYGSRAWQRLRVAASILPPRVTVHELKLVQGVNTLDLEGDFPVSALADPVANWRAGAVRGRLDAHLGDLRAFGELLGPAFPPLTGRLDLNGELRAGVGGEEYPEGSFRVEAGPVSIRGTSLDRFRAEVRSDHGEWVVNGLEARRADDAATGKGRFRLAGGPFRYVAEGRARVQDLARYAGLFPPGMLPAMPRGMINGEWSGDGGAGSHAGAFKGRASGLLVPGDGPGALPRPVDVEAEGTYSPESVAFRRLILRDSGDPRAEFHLRLENVALPWTQDAGALAAGLLSQPDGALAGRLEARDLPLDLLVPVLPAGLGVAPGTDGRVTGWLDLAGTPRVPRFTGSVQLRRARLRWRDQARSWADVDGLAADVFLEGGDHLRIERGGAERAPESGGGGLTFGGRVDWTERTAPLGLDLTFQGKNIGLLDSRTARVRGDLELTVRGMHDAPEITGDVRLRENGRFWRELRFTLDPPPVPPAAGLTLPIVTNAFPADTSWNLHVTAATPLLLEGVTGIRGELRPDLRLTGTAERPVLRGELALRRTRLTLPAAEMEVEQGRLRFDPDAAPGDLLLELAAIKMLPADRKGEPGTRLRADFTGPAAEGRVTFSAEPPVWSPAEVAAFLLEGKVPSPPPAVPEAEPTAGEQSTEPKLYLRLR